MDEHRLMRLDPFDPARWTLAKWPPHQPAVALCSCGYRLHGDSYEHVRQLWLKHHEVATQLKDTA
jgi:hypothetical protein